MKPLPTPPIEAKIVWHDVNESRPFDGDRVIVTSVFDNHLLVEIANYQQNKYAPMGEFWEDDREYGMEIDNVIYWAYLPDPAITPDENKGGDLP